MLFNLFQKHGPNLFIMGLFLLFIGILLYRSTAREVNKWELQNESVLNLAPRNVLRGQQEGEKQVRGPESVLREGLPRTGLPYVPPEGQVTITPKDKSKSLDDLVTIKYRRFGFITNPGLNLSLVPLGLGVDAKLAYFNRTGLIGGFTVFEGEGTMRAFWFSPILGLSYRLDRIKFLKNTEVFGAWAPFSRYECSLGVRVNL